MLLDIKKLKASETKLVIDTSYLMHYKIRSSVSTYLYEFITPPCAKSEYGTYDWTTNEEYIAILHATTINHINKFCKQLNIPARNIIFAIDCSKKNIWRRDFFPEYKQNRIDKQKDDADKEDSFNMGPVFQYFKRFLLPMLTDQFRGSRIVENPVCEGDDIISISTEAISQEFPDNNIVICANDSDLVQLCTNPNIKIFDLKYECVTDRVLKKFILPENIIKIKKLMGDKKDNVDKAFKRCGIKTAFKYLADKQLLKEQVRKEPPSIKQIQLNDILLDLKKIPIGIVREVQEDLYLNYFKKERVTSDLDDL